MVTVQKIEELFAFGKLKNLSGISLNEEDNKIIGNNISWTIETYYYGGYKDIPAQKVPPHIKWSKNPIFAYIGIVNGEVEYHFGTDRNSAYFICPITNDKEKIALIEEAFETLYHYFNLPNS